MNVHDNVTQALSSLLSPDGKTVRSEVFKLFAEAKAAAEQQLKDATAMLKAARTAMDAVEALEARVAKAVHDGAAIPDEVGYDLVTITEEKEKRWNSAAVAQVVAWLTNGTRLYDEAYRHAAEHGWIGGRRTNDVLVQRMQPRRLELFKRSP